MPSIKINEQDLTTGGGRSTNFNVVYVPGFTVYTDTSIVLSNTWPLDSKNSEDKSRAVSANVPTLCQSIAEFEAYFGKKPARFSSNTGTGDSTSTIDVDKSYLYAKELLKLGIPVLYESFNGPNTTPSKETLTSKLVASLDKLKDKGEYQVKYITLGAYASSLFTTTTTGTGDEATTITSFSAAYQKAVEVATDRGDCIVLIDHDNDTNIVFTELMNKFKLVASNMDGADCCAAFTPWVNIDCSTFTPEKGEKSITFSMPPSFAYLTAFAKSIKTNASWLAVAGAARGQIPNLNGSKPLNITSLLTNSVADSFQNRDSVSINAITEIKPFGYRIWGNRTLKNNSTEGNLTATSFLNTRNMICDVKKVVYDACRKYMFEQNNDVLWLNFKSYIEPTLNQMKAGAGLSGYKIIKDEDVNEKAKLSAKIKLYPLYAVEDFEVTIQMLDEEIAVS